MYFVPIRVHRMANNLLTNCVPLAVRKYDSVASEIINLSKNIHAMTVIELLAVGTDRVSFAYLFVIITKCWLPFVFLGSGPKLSVATNSNGLVA